MTRLEAHNKVNKAVIDLLNITKAVQTIRLDEYTYIIIQDTDLYRHMIELTQLTEDEHKTNLKKIQWTPIARNQTFSLNHFMDLQEEPYERGMVLEIDLGHKSYDKMLVYGPGDFFEWIQGDNNATFIYEYTQLVGGEVYWNANNKNIEIHYQHNIYLKEEWIEKIDAGN